MAPYDPHAIAKAIRATLRGAGMDVLPPRRWADGSDTIGYVRYMSTSELSALLKHGIAVSPERKSGLRTLRVGTFGKESA